MTEHKKIYIITAGEYSDYHIVGVAESKEVAKELLSKYKGLESPSIEEYKINSKNDILEIQNKNYYIVRMDREGNSDSEEWERYYTDIDKEIEFSYLGRYSKIPPNTPAMIMFVWANDLTHAVKIANEKRVQMIASGLWEEKERELKSKYSH